MDGVVGAAARTGSGEDGSLAALPAQRGGPGAAEPGPDAAEPGPTEPAPIKSTFTALPRFLLRGRGGPVAQTLVNFAIFSLPPTALFWFWFISEVRPALPERYSGLVYAMPIASLWVSVGPLLMQHAERIEDRWLALLRRDAGFGWNVERVRRRQVQLGRGYYPTVLLGTAATVTSLWFALPVLSAVIQIYGTFNVIAGFFVIAQVGFTSTSGLHGVVKAVAITRASVSGVTLRWHPFQVGHRDSVLYSYRLFRTVGVMFSVGTVFVPALVVVDDTLVGPARPIVRTFIALLLVGGLVLFLLPSINLLAALRRSKRFLLERIATPLQGLLEDGLYSDRLPQADRVRAYGVMDSLLAIRGAVSGATVAPKTRVLYSMTLTVVVPSASVAFSLLEPFLRR